MFKITNLIGADIRSRANADIIRSAIDGIREDVILDFSGVTFVSRCFTDELYNVLKENRNISLVNMSDFVESMMNAVKTSRDSKRAFKEGRSEMKELDDMKSLSAFMATI